MAENNEEISVEAISAASAEQLSAITASLGAQFAEADAAGDEAKMNDLVGLMAAAAERRTALTASASEPEPEAETPEATPDQAKADETPEETPAETPEAKVEETPAEEVTPEPEAKVEETPAEATDPAPAEVQANTEEIKEETPMAASIETQGSDTEVEVPESHAPVLVASVQTIVAGADIPGKSAGTEFVDGRDVNTAFLAKLNAVRKSPSGSGERHIVASVAIEYPEERMLEGLDSIGTTERIEKVTSLDAITAAGGCCAPLESRYDVFGMGSTARPVRDSLPAFGTTRMGIRYVGPPVLGDLSGAIGLWACSTDAAAAANPLALTTAALTSNVVTLTTAADHGLSVGDTVQVDAANPVFNGTFIVASVPSDTTFTYALVHANVASAADAGTVSVIKACLRVECADERTAEVVAVPLCLKFGNLMSRAFPELVAKNNDLALVEHARFSERHLLGLIDSHSTQTAHAHVFGTSRDFLLGLGRAASLYRNRHRLDRSHPIRVIAPETVLDEMRDDLAAQLPGDSTLGVTDSIIESYLSVRRINVTWHMDATTPAQGAGDLNCYPATFEVYLFAEGTFIFLDGGTLDLGIIRDSGLVSTNDYITFVETFEGIAFIGAESVAITFTSAVEGATMGTLNPATVDYCTVANA